MTPYPYIRGVQLKDDNHNSEPQTTDAIKEFSDWLDSQIAKGETNE